MVEAQKYRIEQEMTKMVEDLDRRFLRKMQGDMHRCAARCCDDGGASVSRLHACIETCSAPLARTNAYLENEISSFQNRLQRCVMDCNDSAKDGLGVDRSQQAMDRCTAEFERCAVRCVDRHVALLPPLARTLADAIAGGNH